MKVASVPLALARSRRRCFVRSPRRWRGLGSRHEASPQPRRRGQQAPRRGRSKRRTPSQGPPLNPAQERMPRGRARGPRITQRTRAASPAAVTSGRSRHRVPLLVAGSALRQSRWICRNVPRPGGFDCATVISTTRTAERVVAWAASRDRRRSAADHGVQLWRDRGCDGGLGSARSERIGKLRDVGHLRASGPHG